MSRLSVLLLLSLLAACDDTPGDDKLPAPPTANAPLDWRPVTTLQAGRPTAVLARQGGGVYVFQARGDSAVRLVNAAGQVQTLPITSARLAATIGPRAAAANPPRLAATATLSGGELLLVTVGTARRQSLVSLQRYDPATDRLTLLMPAGELASASGLGDSIDVADAHLAVSGPVAWLWLRTPDRSVVLRFDTRQLASGVARPVRPFADIRAEGAEAVPWRPGPATTLVGRGDGAFWMLDPDAGQLWSVDAAGRATLIEPPTGRPAPSAPPLVLGDGEAAPRLSFYPAPRDRDAVLPAATGQTRYPLLDVTTGRAARSFDRDGFAPRPVFPVHALRLTAWARESQTGDVIAYDHMSGELLRLVVPQARQ